LVIDNIFELKILNDKIWEYNQSVQYLFIDLQEAYDSIHTDTLWKGMEEFKIPTKLINMCKTCVQKTRSAVRIEGTLSYFFKNKMRLKQGDYHQYYSIQHYSIKKVIQSIEPVLCGITIGKGQLNISAFEDDTVLIAKNETE
jgi:hypothetical protein